MLSFKDFLEEAKDPCWKGYEMIGMKKKDGKKVPNCVPVKEEAEQIDESSDIPVHIHKSPYEGAEHGEHTTVFKASPDSAQRFAKHIISKGGKARIGKRGQDHYVYHNKPITKDEWRKSESSVREELSAEEQFNLIEEMVMDLAEEHSVDTETVWEIFESFSDEELYEAAVDAKGYKSSTGGLTQKGRDHYNRTTGSNLKAPVTTPPSELKAGSKAANRRKSFCARMSGVKGPMKDEKGRPTRKALALRKWNC